MPPGLGLPRRVTASPPAWPASTGRVGPHSRASSRQAPVAQPWPPARSSSSTATSCYVPRNGVEDAAGSPSSHPVPGRSWAKLRPAWASS
eukprot:2469116-Pyramimonas_sp.AAC.2